MKGQTLTRRTRTPARAHIAGLASLALIFAQGASGANSAWAAEHAVGRTQSGPGPCKINGVLVDPPLPSGVPSRWLFLANFDYPNSATNVVTCLVFKDANGTTYDVVTHHCTLVAASNPNKKRFGGAARFDGGAHPECTINPTPPPLDPPNVWVAARVNVPTTAQQATVTLVDSEDIAFNVRNDPTCARTLNSRYDNFDFAHATVSTCGSFASIESHLANGDGKNVSMQGRHRVTTTSGTMFYGPSEESGRFSFEPVFAFKIALPGEIFTLDWLLIDPDSVKCCGGI